MLWIRVCINSTLSKLIAIHDYTTGLVQSNYHFPGPYFLSSHCASTLKERPFGCSSARKITTRHIYPDYVWKYPHNAPLHYYSSASAELGHHLCCCEVFTFDCNYCGLFIYLFFQYYKQKLHFVFSPPELSQSAFCVSISELLIYYFSGCLVLSYLVCCNVKYRISCNLWCVHHNLIPVSAEPSATHTLTTYVSWRRPVAACK